MNREHEGLFVRPLKRHLLTDGESLIAPLLQQFLRHLIRVEELLRRRFLQSAVKTANKANVYEYVFVSDCVR